MQEKNRKEKKVFLHHFFNEYYQNTRNEHKEQKYMLKKNRKSIKEMSETKNTTNLKWEATLEKKVIKNRLLSN